jgi:hypothetical protein
VWLAAPGAAQGDTQAFCQARLDAETAILAEDEEAARAALDRLETTAPPEVADAAATLADLLARRGPAAFETKKGGKAADAIDEFVVASCGFPVLEVSAIDYEYQGVPRSLSPGPHVIRFTNDAPKEHHEMVLLRLEPGVEIAPKKLLALPEKKLARQADFVGAAFAPPGKHDEMVVSLEPGRYVYGCFIEVGTTSGSEEEHEDEHGGAADPHWKEGMYGQLEVEATP